MVAIPFSQRKIFPVYVVREVLAYIEIARAHAWDWNEGHYRPVANQQKDAQGHALAWLQVQKRESSEKVTDRNALQNAQKADLLETFGDALVGKQPEKIE